MADRDLFLLACPGADKFARKLLGHLKRHSRRVKMIDASFPTFKNGETKCILNETVRGADMFIVQDVANRECGSVNDALMSLFVAIDSCNHASVDEINVVIPTFPYARQHKKTQREGLTASMICHMLEGMGVDRIITLDIHSREIQNSFSSTIMENLHASAQIVRTMKKKNIDLSNLVVVAPDSGAIERNKFFAINLHRPLCMIYKERDYSKISTSSEDSNIKSMRLVGDVDHSDILIVDDMIDTGGTILHAAKFLKETGVNDIYIACSLPFFNDPAIDDFQKAKNDGVIKAVIGTNAVYNPRLWERDWFYKADVTELLADVMLRINDQVTLSDIVDGTDEMRQIMMQPDPSEC